MNEKKTLKVMIVNGSTRPGSNTSQVLSFMREIFERNGVETVWIDVPADLPGCTGCAACKTSGRCIQNDLVTRATDLWDECDGLLVGSPVYFSGISGSVKCFMDRLCYSSMRDRRAKVGGAVVCVRRGGGTAAIDQLNHYLLYSGMCVAGSTYWPMVYGSDKGEAMQDAEGLNTAANLANNMIFMMRAFALGKETYGLPELEPKVKMNFIR